jgi:zinc protease
MGGFILASFSLAILFAQASADTGLKKLATIEGITEYQLDNGLRVLLFPDPSTSAVTVNLTVNVGSRHEGYGETGMAHLLEHMLFKGTPRHQDIPKALRDHGARFNGTTWLDRTNYFETLPATDANLEFAIALEADRLVNSYVKREDLASEMTVVRNEFEMGENNPEQILAQRMMAVAYEWHNYGKSTIGNRSDIERVPIDSLQAFYHKYYQPDNAVLIIAGKFEPAKALALVDKYFGALRRPERKLQETYTEEPAQDGERTVILRRVGKVGVVGVLYHVSSGAHEDMAALDILEQILTDEPTGRLYKALVETKLATQVSGSVTSYHDPGVLQIMAQVASGKPMEPVRDKMLQMLEDLPAQPVTSEEVERAKRRLLKQAELLLTDSNQVGRALSESIGVGDWRMLFLERDRLAKVTPADVMRVAARYLQPSNRTVGLFIPTVKPQRAEIPPPPDLAALVKDYRGGQAIALGEAFDPTPENIEKHVQRLQLPSGVKLALLPKKTRGQIVNVQLTLRYGNAQSLRGFTSAASMMGSLMLRGTKSHTRQQLQDELDKLKARVSTGGGGIRAMLTGAGDTGQLTFTIECKRESLQAVLRLVGEVLREPTFPQEEFDVLKRQSKDELEKMLTEPIYLGLTSLLHMLHPYPPEDVRYVPTVEESITRLQALTIDKVRQLYVEQLGGQVGEAAVVGDFDPAATPNQFEDFLKNWKAAVGYQRIERDAPPPMPGERKVIETPDKANAAFFAGQRFPMNDTSPDYPALKLADYIFGEGPLSSRLSNRVRGKEGLSYTVMSILTAAPLDLSGAFLMLAITNPKNMSKVNTAIAQELDKMIKDGVTEKEVTEAKKAFLQQLKLQWSNDGTLAMALADKMHANRTFAFYVDLEKKIAGLLPDQVSQAFRKYIDPKRLMIVEAGDFKKDTEVKK